MDKIRAHWLVSFEDIPKAIKVDLVLLRLSLERSENNPSKAEVLSAASLEPSMKKIVSSAYCKRGTDAELRSGSTTVSDQ